MKIAVEYIRWLIDERNKINKIPLDEIVFMENGLLLDIPKEVTDKFSLIGLNNIDFISSGFYRLISKGDTHVDGICGSEESKPTRRRRRKT